MSFGIITPFRINYLQRLYRIVLFYIVVYDILKSLRIKKVLVFVTDHLFVTLYRIFGIFIKIKIKFFFHLFASLKEQP